MSISLCVIQSTKLRNKFDAVYGTCKSVHAGDPVDSMYLSWSDMLDVLAQLEM